MSQEERSGPREKAAPDRTTAPSVAVDAVDYLDISGWIAEHQAAERAAYDQRRTWLAQAHAEHKRARDYGLKARHAAKVARRKRGMPPAP